ncbi:hypothetical protein [Sphingopyxis sp. BSNA05]|uniref:hypothetical protein n=1 Tax=Sphingopyxis sp. BSNA05 TaxID=1236614 RepID=UPI0020B6FAE3|nr:hypothetical protein [Sphingopyxis sp. BSNA05]
MRLAITPDPCPRPNIPVFTGRSDFNMVAPADPTRAPKMDNRTISNSRIEWGFMITLLVIISLAFAVLIEPFFGAVVWGVVVAVLFRPVYERLLGYLPGRANLVAAITLILILLLVIVPAILLGMALAQEAATIYLRMQEGEIDFGAVLRPLKIVCRNGCRTSSPLMAMAISRA